jgi:dTDP-4-dehydrorhamnose 3,5-epimerase
MGNFTFHKTKLDGVMLIEANVYGDERGYFMETFHRDAFAEAGFDRTFVQDNQSKSKKGVLRGLHFQKTKPQGKLVRVLEGAVFDVAVDLRRDSPTFGRWESAVLDSPNKMFFVPEGFAHGFLTLSDYVVFTYKCTQLYDRTDEGGLLWNDPDLSIGWPVEGLEVLLSEKDKHNPPLKAL